MSCSQDRCVGDEERRDRHRQCLLAWGPLADGPPGTPPKTRAHGRPTTTICGPDRRPRAWLVPATAKVIKEVKAAPSEWHRWGSIVLPPSQAVQEITGPRARIFAFSFGAAEGTRPLLRSTLGHARSPIPGPVSARGSQSTSLPLHTGEEDGFPSRVGAKSPRTSRTIRLSSRNNPPCLQGFRGGQTLKISQLSLIVCTSPINKWPHLPCMLRTRSQVAPCRAVTPCRAVAA